MNLIIDQGIQFVNGPFSKMFPRQKQIIPDDALEPAAVFHTRHPEEMLSQGNI